MGVAAVSYGVPTHIRKEKHEVLDFFPPDDYIVCFEFYTKSNQICKCYTFEVHRI